MQTDGTSPQDRFYLPTLGERLRLMGWRNVLWLPPIAMLLWIASAAFYNVSSLFSLLWWWKPITFAFGLPLAAAVRASTTALAKRTDPFCIHCGYSLIGLPMNGDRFTCPECGASVDPIECNDYRRDPHWFIQRRRLQHPVEHAPFEAGTVREDNPDHL